MEYHIQRLPSINGNELLIFHDACIIAEERISSLETQRNQRSKRVETAAKKKRKNLLVLKTGYYCLGFRLNPAITPHGMTVTFKSKHLALTWYLLIH